MKQSMTMQIQDSELSFNTLTACEHSNETVMNFIISVTSSPKVQYSTWLQPSDICIYYRSWTPVIQRKRKRHFPFIKQQLLTCRGEWGGLQGRRHWAPPQIRPGCWHLQWECPHLGSSSPSPHADRPPSPTLIAYNSGKQRGRRKKRSLITILNVSKSYII